jgi:hypothetical protein
MEDMYIRKEFLLANGLSELPNASMTDDLSPISYFDGDDMVSFDGNLEFSEASGSRRRAKRRVKKAKKGTSPRRQRGGGTMSDRRQTRRDDRNARKRQETQVQQKAIQDVQKQAQADAQLLAQLNQPTTPTIPTPTASMSRNTKIALTIGGVAVALFVGFVVYKKMKK